MTAKKIVKKNIRELSDQEIIELVRRIREDLSRLEILALKRGRKGRKILEMYYNGKISYNKAIKALKNK